MPTRSGGQIERLSRLFLAFVYAGDAIAALNASRRGISLSASSQP